MEKRGVQKKCVYCGKDLAEEIVIDVCVRCGQSVWGAKMFKAIVENMESARLRGSLNQGSVSDNKSEAF